ncbi:MAG: hypothetical protein GXO11_01460 [Epsilonproteobacteria bacterium]|nr:hypothetical protein [Campylobacterota bacterium]
MKIYYYVHTGHRIGLDRFRRASAIIKALKGIDITLLTSDYRIASVAREYGIEKSVGIDVVRNIANIAQQGDKLIFDSPEANPIMLEDMRNYFSTFIRISDEPNDTKVSNEFLISPYVKGDGICHSLAIDEEYFQNFKKDITISYFFGDDDYEKDLEKHFDFINGLDLYLQLGFYYFFDYEDMLKEKFPNHFEFDDYKEMIQRTDILISASPQAVLESLASGGRPIYFQREDYPQDFIPLFETLHIPIIKNYDKELLHKTIKLIKNNSYDNYKRVDNNCYKIANFIKKHLNL